MSAGKWLRSNSAPDSKVHKFEKKNFCSRTVANIGSWYCSYIMHSFIDSSCNVNKVNTYIVNDSPQVILSEIWLYIYPLTDTGIPVEFLLLHFIQSCSNFLLNAIKIREGSPIKTLSNKTVCNVSQGISSGEGFK